MKNPSLMTASALIGLAVVVGAATYLTSGDGDDQAVSLIEAVEPVERVTYKDLSPHEMRKKGRLEEAKRYLARVKQEGKDVGGLIKIKDTSGDPLYVWPELIEGVGAYGEQKFMMAQVKRRAGVPLVQPIRPAGAKAKLSKKKVQVGFAQDAPNYGDRGGMGDGEDDGGN